MNGRRDEKKGVKAIVHLQTVISGLHSLGDDGGESDESLARKLWRTMTPEEKRCTMDIYEVVKKVMRGE